MVQGDAKESDAIVAANTSGSLVLIVDDNDVNCMVAESMLKILGYKTQTAKSGHDAIALAHKTKFDVVLMDWQMPELNGFDTARKIWDECALNRETIMIAVTANAFSEDKAACLNHGFKAVLTKPFDVDQLDAVVGEQLRMK